MYNNLINKFRLNEKFNSITAEQNKADRHKKLQDKFVTEYAEFKKKLKKVKPKNKLDKPPKKISPISKININHYATLKAIAKVVGIDYKY
tara:strand:- start:173 stop:442 length:270 start_codon:yes stop_codon:yes gene_type:complete